MDASFIRKDSDFGWARGRDVIPMKEGERERGILFLFLFYFLLLDYFPDRVYDIVRGIVNRAKTSHRYEGGDGKCLNWYPADNETTE